MSENSDYSTYEGIRNEKSVRSELEELAKQLPDHAELLTKAAEELHRKSDLIYYCCLDGIQLKAYMKRKIPPMRKRWTRSFATFLRGILKGFGRTNFIKDKEMHNGGMEEVVLLGGPGDGKRIAWNTSSPVFSFSHSNGAEIRRFSDPPQPVTVFVDTYERNFYVDNGKYSALYVHGSVAPGKRLELLIQGYKPYKAFKHQACYSMLQAARQRIEWMVVNRNTSPGKEILESMRGVLDECKP